jgi:hypothetical protein
MEAMVNNESAKVNRSISAWGELEYYVAGEIALWILQNTNKFDSMSDAINAFWSERLSYE